MPSPIPQIRTLFIGDNPYASIIPVYAKKQVKVTLGGNLSVIVTDLDAEAARLMAAKLLRAAHLLDEEK